MRLGVFIGDASGLRTDVDALLANAREAEQLGFATGWLPHIPWSLDALTAVALAGQVTSRIELGTAVVPTYPRHPVSMAQQALSAQAACGGRAVLGHRAVASGRHRADARPAVHPARRATPREYVDVLKLAFHGTGHVSHEGEFFQVEAMLEVPGASELPVLVAALAPLMLRDGRHQGRRHHHLLGQRARHRRPRRPDDRYGGGQRPDARRRGWWPASRSLSSATSTRPRSGRPTLFAGYNGIPAYQRIRGEGGDDALPDIAIIGDEKTVEARLRGYADAGRDRPGRRRHRPRRRPRGFDATHDATARRPGAGARGRVDDRRPATGARPATASAPNCSATASRTTITAAAPATGVPSEFMSNSQGRVHGGLVGTIIDDIAAIALRSSDPTIATSSTVSMHIDYLRPLVIGADYICTGEVLRIGGRLAVADARIVDADGQLAVRGSATFAITRFS